ncbi:SPFH domain-containing protein [Nitrosomonas sp.]|uniref:SPFH domain-containing protein n=1 Tax=Nitrosomonas sp. TaxID=42353 RepID=UPI0025CBE5E3|nr:SPFH domain-containing protein [Nitrosomonas sp.]MBY0484590.1 hypothetical protein [Nitrosomonas sp.]
MIAVFFVTACGRIETGNVGVRVNGFNKQVQENEVPAGFYIAVVDSVSQYVTKETELALDNLKPKAKDNLSLTDLDASIFYTVNPDKVADLVIRYSGMSPKNEDDGLYYPGFGLLERLTRGVIYDTIAHFESLTLHTKRSEVEAAILKQIQDELDKTDPGVFSVTKVVIRQVVTDPALEQSIRAAVQMQKQVEAKQNELELAKAEAARMIVEAQGTADSNDIISKSLTPSYLRYKEIEAMQSFAHEGTHTVVLPSGINPLVSIK